MLSLKIAEIDLPSYHSDPFGEKLPIPTFKPINSFLSLHLFAVKDLLDRWCNPFKNFLQPLEKSNLGDILPVLFSMIPDLIKRRTMLHYPSPIWASSDTMMVAFWLAHRCFLFSETFFIDYRIEWFAVCLSVCIKGLVDQRNKVFGRALIKWIPFVNRTLSHNVAKAIGSIMYISGFCTLLRYIPEILIQWTQIDCGSKGLSGGIWKVCHSMFVYRDYSSTLPVITNQMPKLRYRVWQMNRGHVRFKGAWRMWLRLPK